MRQEEGSVPESGAGGQLGFEGRGGVSQQLSLVVGFSQLLFVAIAYYLLSLVFRPRSA